MKAKQPAPLTDSFLSEISRQAITWGREAGQIAMHYFNNVSVAYKADDTLVTQADIEIELFIINQIKNTYPDHNLISEESCCDHTQSTSPYTWVIDPLDGTTAFIKGLPGWGISIGLLYANQPVFGMFYMPLLEDLTHATRTEIDNIHQTTLPTVQRGWQNHGFLAVSTGAHHDYQINLPRIRALGSVGASLVYTARGSAAAAFIPKAYLWDLVAGALILNNAGGQIRYLSGRPLDYATLLNGRLAPEPIIAGHPDVLIDVQRAVHPPHAERAGSNN